MTRVRSARSRRYGVVPELSAEYELELAKTIAIAREAGDKATKKQLRAADEAVDELIRSYSPFIERIARQHFSRSGEYGVGLEDFISEAYAVAVQCARSFDPTKGQSQIRFSSYFSRPATSTLNRVSMRSRSPVSVPVTVMAAARKWSHTHYEAVNRGLKISDEDVSALSGVDGSQRSVAQVLGLASLDPIEDTHPPVSDEVRLLDPDDCRRELTWAIERVFGDRAEEYLSVFGLKTGRALTTAYLMRTEGRYDSQDMRGFMANYRERINHPLTRMALSRELREHDNPREGEK